MSNSPHCMDPTVHYYVHNSLPLEPILNNWIWSNLKLYPQCRVFLQLQIFSWGFDSYVLISHISHACHTFHKSYFPSFQHPSNIPWSPTSYGFSHSVTCSLLTPRYFPQCPVLKHSQSVILLTHRYKTGMIKDGHLGLCATWQANSMEWSPSQPVKKFPGF